MSRRSTPPSLRRHKPSRQGVVTLAGRDHYLGHWPADHSTPPEAVRAAYDGLVAEWLAAGRPQVLVSRPTVAELMLSCSVESIGRVVSSNGV